MTEQPKATKLQPTEAGLFSDQGEEHTAPDRPPSYVDRAGRPTYRASALGGCLTGLVAARLGVTPTGMPEKLTAAMRESQDLEPVAIEAAEHELGYTITNQQSSIKLTLPEESGQTTLTGPTIVGHLDGQMDSVMAPPVEVKCLGEDYFREWRKAALRGDFSSASKAVTSPFRQYIFQLSTYIHALSAEYGLFTIYSKEDGELIITELWADVIDLENIANRVYQIERTIQLGDIIHDPECTGFCNYYFLHPNTNEDIDDSTIDGQTFDEIAEEYNEAKEEEKEAKAKKDSARDKLKRWKEQKEQDDDTPQAAAGDKVTYESAENKVTFSVKANRKLDEAKLDEELAPLEISVDDFKTVTYSGQVQVTKKG